MKILELYVRNFAPIMMAMNRRELRLDFRNNNNLLILLIGGNGTGKTTICSLLHPFAYNGDVDSRDRKSLIIKDEEGYKSLTVKDNDDIYYIQHFYYRNTEGGLSIKSYIKKNNEELNPNGNVTSFKAIVETCFGIDESYIKLIRLGANVINLISMNASERKEFMNKRLEELDIYGKFWKKTSDDLRLIKTLLKNNLNRINSLNIVNI